MKASTMQNELKMAACGIDCSQCGQYKATMENDLAAAATLVEWFRGQGWIGKAEGAEAVMAKAPLCKGCWQRTADCFFKCGCNKKDFAQCCRDRQIDHCGQCADFPCEPYSEWTGWDTSCKKAMERLLSLKPKTLSEYT